MLPTRRRSPGWVRALDDRTCHAILVKMERTRPGQDLSERQEALWDCLVSELEYRRRNHPRPMWACSCRFCVAPFPEVN